MFRRCVVLIVGVIFVLLNSIEAARILCVFPIPSISHQIVFKKYTQELAKHGHELVIITPNPYLPKDRPKDNVIEIDVSSNYKHLDQGYKDNEEKVKMKRGAILDVDTLSMDTILMIVNVLAKGFSLPEVKNVLNNTSDYFDLIVVEAILDYSLAVTNFFKAPVIQFSSFFGTSDNFNTMGTITRHPILYPHIVRKKFKNLNIWEKIRECFLELKIFYGFEILLPKEINRMWRRDFGDNVMTVREVKTKVDMMFLNIHPMYDGNRPAPPNLIYLGHGYHLQPVQELPTDLKLYLDNSKNGVIYGSLGTNVRTELMQKDLINVYMETFKSLPYDILWKFDIDLENRPSNVKIQKWFPQRDILKHPNIKLFIMQGGVQSTDEAIDAEVPMVITPFLGDQWFTAHKSEEYGIAVTVDTETMTSKDLLAAVNKVIDDQSYRANIKKLKELMSDQPQTPVEKAIWWTEHVIRHNGAHHLKCVAANVPWDEYFMVDVILAAIILCLSIIAVLVTGTCYIFSKIFKRSINFNRYTEKLKNN